jgi:hypothetical protein
MLDNSKDKKKYIDMVGKVITLIMGGTRTQNIEDVLTAVKSDNVGAAMQGYVCASFDYYMSKKKDDGVLYIDVSKEPIATVYFKTAKDLEASSLRFHADTPYITATKDHRLPYPQVKIVPTTFGANAAAKQQKIMAKQAAIDTKAEKLKKNIAAGRTNLDLRPNGAPPAAPPSPTPHIKRPITTTKRGKQSLSI